jgi:hypothetical protein
VVFPGPPPAICLEISCAVRRAVSGKDQRQHQHLQLIFFRTGAGEEVRTEHLRAIAANLIRSEHQAHGIQQLGPLPGAGFCWYFWTKLCRQFQYITCITCTTCFPAGLLWRAFSERPCRNEGAVDSHTTGNSYSFHSLARTWCIDAMNFDEVLIKDGIID